MDPAMGPYSCDDHLDLRAVPPGLWQSRLPRALAERGPRVVEYDGESVWDCEDRVLGGSGGSRKGDVRKLSAIGRASIEDDGFRAGNPKLRLKDMDRMDLEWRNLRDKIDYAPQTLPSELFRRQVLATFEEEAVGTELIPLRGADCCMWASDYPHTDSTFPNLLASIEESLGPLPAPDRRKITATNCARLYGFESAA